MHIQPIAQPFAPEEVVDSLAGFIVGVDVGGTFTDASAVALDDGRIHTAKARSTPDDLILGLTVALELLAEQTSLTLRDLLSKTVKFAHGTTLLRVRP